MEPVLRRLLARYNAQRSAQTPFNPWLRLPADGVFEVAGWSPDRGYSDVAARGTVGGFVPGVRAALSMDPLAVPALAASMLAENFASSLHADILTTCGLANTVPAGLLGTGGRPRDHGFPDRVFDAWGRACVVCGWDAGDGTDEGIGVQAAHVQWHCFDGPDTADNGLPLCALHHVCFDRGLWGISEDWTIRVASSVEGGPEVLRGLIDRHSHPLRGEGTLASHHVEWHTTQVLAV
ncbi:hypothetical protein DVS28_b0196 (plasmid) [Euzebya pacifica]|uniref:Uncharacterized protein n=1 Tax=Euzebya pacifica TaxID=1608957 RepID=A0A346Y669_9ACTN|nr:HNH endonuclease [Euzebya pacifica]AXV09966.1 hypothetical protein DVS28_b0196 [Euzebya pacifica]